MTPIDSFCILNPSSFLYDSPSIKNKLNITKILYNKKDIYLINRNLLTNLDKNSKFNTMKKLNNYNLFDKY